MTTNSTYTKMKPKKDLILPKLMQYATSNWPRNKVPPEIAPYMPVRDEISVVKGLCTKTHKNSGSEQP